MGDVIEFTVDLSRMTPPLFIVDDLCFAALGYDFFTLSAPLPDFFVRRVVVSSVSLFGSVNNFL